ncbi:hypothetical protein [Vibrio sp.]|uniref:hypothetical protein n=1 Tax=Vibrio sp. TaxID=678 RepID=UPI00311FFE77
MQPLWTYEKLKEAAAQYTTRIELRANNGAAYKAAWKRGILDDVCSHMDNLITNWTDEMIVEEALKYSTRGEFAENSNAYQIAAKRGILDDVCGHMKLLITRWTEDMIIEEALKYNSRSEFKDGNKLAYTSALRRGILDKACAHMTPKNRQWSNEDIAKEALKYQRRNEFQKASTAYGIATVRGILDEVCAHMEYTARVNWTSELLAAEAKKYATRTDFYKKNNNAYSYARRLGILDEITQHLGYKDTYNTRDVVYLWFAEGDIFKVGITSQNLGDQRIYDVAKDAGFDPKTIIMEIVGTVRAKQLEGQILKMGKPVSFKRNFSGSSEFRHLTFEELEDVIEIIRAG